MFHWATNSKLKLSLRVCVPYWVWLLSFNCSTQVLLLCYFSLTVSSKPGVSIYTLFESTDNMKLIFCLAQTLYFLLPSTSTLKTGSIFLTQVT